MDLCHAAGDFPGHKRLACSAIQYRVHTQKSIIIIIVMLQLFATVYQVVDIGQHSYWKTQVMSSDVHLLKFIGVVRLHVQCMQTVHTHESIIILNAF